MPVRRRKNKARPDEAKAWLMFMMSGCDFFDDLVDAGIVPEGEVPTREFAEETWRRIGNDVLDYMEEFHIGYRPPERPIWAKREFGPPGRSRRRAGAR